MFGKKSENTYRARIIASVPATEKWNSINEMGGSIYSSAMHIAREIYEETGKMGGITPMRRRLKKWLEDHAVPCAAHSAYAIQAEFLGAFKSFFAKRKKDATAKPPYRTPKFHTFTWIATCIKAENNQLRLAMGNREYVYVPIAEKRYQGIVPATVKLVYNRDKHAYDFIATYELQRLKSREKGGITAVDLGEIHPIVDFDGAKSTVYNGRFHRSLVQYRQKFLARINQKLSRCKRGSRRWRYLKRT